MELGPQVCRRSPTHVVHCRFGRTIISQVIAPAASVTAAGGIFKASIFGSISEPLTLIVLLLVYGHQVKLIPACVRTQPC